MNDQRFTGAFWAAGLIVAGVLLLLFNLDLLARYEPLAQYVLAGLLAVFGLAFFGVFVSNRQTWWRLIPGWTLVALSGMVVASTFDNVDRALTASLLFAGLAIAFFNIYLLNRRVQWWSLIPGGFLLVLGVVIALSGVVERVEILGTVLFVGMGAVFFLLHLLTAPDRQWWALIPGSILVLFGLFVFSVDGDAQNTLVRWWPVGLIFLGLAIAWRTATKDRTPQKLSVNTAPGKTRESDYGADRSVLVEKQNVELTGRLGDYSEPAPGASIDILPDRDEEK